MAKIDIETLIAPIEKLRPALSDAYKRLDVKWEEISEALRSLPLPCDVSFSLNTSDGDPEGTSLVWKKWNGKKRICLEFTSYQPGVHFDSDFVVDTKPYEEWSAQQRVEMLEHVPGLFQAAAQATQDFIDKTKV